MIEISVTFLTENKQKMRDAAPLVRGLPGRDNLSQFLER